MWRWLGKFCPRSRATTSAHTMQGSFQREMRMPIFTKVGPAAPQSPITHSGKQWSTSKGLKPCARLAMTMRFYGGIPARESLCGTRRFVHCLMRRSNLSRASSSGEEIHAHPMISLRQDFDLLSSQQPKRVGFTIDEQASHLKPGRCSKRYNLAKHTNRIGSERFPLAVDP